MKLDYVLALKPEDFMERRLQTQVFKLGLAKSIHHARVLIRQRHIRVRKQVVNVPSLIVWTARNTLISASNHPSVVAVLVVSRGRTLRRAPAVVTTMKSKLGNLFVFKNFWILF